MMFDYWVSTRMEFSTEDKRACLETAKIIVELCHTVRKGGILALESEETDEMVQDALLKKAISLIVDGLMEEDVRKILQNYIVVGNYRNRRLLKRLLILEGMMAMQQGNSPGFIRDSVLASFFGEGFWPEYSAYFAINEKEQGKKITMGEFLKQIKDSQSDKQLEGMEIFEKFDDMAMQTIVREVSANDIVYVFKGLSEIAVKNFLSNMSRRCGEFIMENYLLSSKNIREKDMIDAKDRILDAVRIMEETGMIYIEKD